MFAMKLYRYADGAYIDIVWYQHQMDIEISSIYVCSCTCTQIFGHAVIRYEWIEEGFSFPRCFFPYIYIYTGLIRQQRVAEMSQRIESNRKIAKTNMDHITNCVKNNEWKFNWIKRNNGFAFRYLFFPMQHNIPGASLRRSKKKKTHLKRESTVICVHFPR